MDDLTTRIQSLPAEKREQVRQIVKEKLAVEQAQYDVIILGGGMSGSTLARQLKQTQPDIRILIVEKGKYPVPEAAFKVGESTVEVGAYYLSEVLGLKGHLETCQLVKAGLRYFFPASDNSDIARRIEVGLTDFPPVSGYQIDRGRLENQLYKENIKQGIEVWTGCKVQSVALNQPHQATLIRDNQKIAISARWVVDASGRAGTLKRQLGLAQTVDHNINSVWFRIADTINVADWSDDSRWKTRAPDNIRLVSTSHLMGQGYWVWIICLASNVTSIGIVAEANMHPHSEMNNFKRAMEWLKLHEPQFANVIEEKRDLLQDFHALKHFTHGCERVFSAERWCITGDAGIFADPLYSPGADFIAISNSLVTNLIVRDLKGENIKTLVEHYHLSYLSLFKRYLVTYQQQYSLLGNPQVMIAKIVWDWAIYWGLTALLFFHNNKIFNWEWMSSVQHELHRFNQLNDYMQQFFRKWSKFEQREYQDNFISLLGLDFLYDLHTGLKANLDDEALKVQLVKNIDLLEAIAKGMHHQVAQQVAQLSNNGHETQFDNPLGSEPWLADDWAWQTKTEVPADLSKIWLFEPTSN